MGNYSNLGRDLGEILSGCCTGQQNKYEFSELCSCDVKKGLRIKGAHIFVNSQNESRYFWSYDTCHRFPSAEELAALASFFQKPVLYACGLLLKGAWEKHVADIRHWQHKNSLNVRLDELLEKAFYPDRRRVHDMFAPDIEDFYSILQKYDFGKRLKIHNFEAFSMLIYEMQLNRFYLEPLGSATFALFIERKEAEIWAYQNATEVEIESFHNEKLKWLELKKCLGDNLLRLENCRLANKQLGILWLKEFGNEFMEMSEEFESMSLYLKMLELKQNEPGLSLEELRDLAAGRLDESEERLENLEANVGLGQMLEFAPEADEQEQARIKKECEVLLRKISLLTHPDRLEHNPQFVLMTENQKQYLKELFLRSRELKGPESALSSSDICWNEDKLFNLSGMLLNIEEIYASAGVDSNIEMMIKGESIAEKTVFLMNENQFLSKQVAESKTLLAKSFADRDAIEKHRQLGSPELYDRIKEMMRQQTEAYRHESCLIQNDLNALYTV